jgi:hypothetical protein
MVSRQLELGFENRPGLKPAGRSRGRSGRANYWFERMRGVVNEARDWPPASPPRHAPRLAEVPASAEGPSSGIAPPTAEPSPPDAGANARAPEPPRWKFGRARRMIWE